MHVWVLKRENTQDLRIFSQFNKNEGIDYFFSYIYNRGYEKNEPGWSIKNSNNKIECFYEDNLVASFNRVETDLYD